jgi:transposase
MMGERQSDQPELLYGFSLKRHVPADHLLRSIDRFVDLGDIRAQLRPFYSDMGRPSIDPELMIRMLIIGYCMGIRSERRLCDEVHLNLAYRWFCRLGLEGAAPDHSTFSKTGTVVSARATCFASCSRRRSPAALPRVWSAARALPSMPA